MRKNLCISDNCCIFASEKETNNKLNPKTRKGTEIMKKQLAKQYIELKKQFDGKDFKSGIKAHNIDYLVENFKVIDLKDKIEAVKSAIKAREQRLAKA